MNKKLIESKITLGLPLTKRERAFAVLFMNYNISKNGELTKVINVGDKMKRFSGSKVVEKKALTDKDVKKIISQQFGFYVNKICLLKYTCKEKGVCEFADFVVNGVNYQMQRNCVVGNYKLRIPKHFNARVYCEE